MAGLVVGVDVGGTKALLLASRGVEAVSERRIATGPDFTAPALVREIAAFLESLPAAPEAVGLAVPGIVDDSGRVVACDVLRGLDGFLFTLSGIQTVVLNDTAAALVAARADFAPAATAALVMVGTAIGAAFQMNGVVARGAKGWAGELGYVPIQMQGGVQRLDDVAGGAAILKRCGLSAQELSNGLASQDERLLELVKDAGRGLGLGLATLINLLNPELIVLGGGTLAYSGYVQAALEQAQASSLPDLWRCCRVTITPHGERLVAHGAALAARANAGPQRANS
jgi:glucokinase